MTIHRSIIFDRLRKYNLKLKPEKCEFGLPRIKLLGHVVSEDGLSPDPGRINTIKFLKPPRNLRETRSFLGLAGYYRFSVPNFAQIANPLHELTRKHVKFEWTVKRQNSFQKIKDMLVSHHVMALPNTRKPYIIYTDASQLGTGAILCQEDDKGVEKVIHYASQALSPTQQKYASMEQEMLAIVHALQKFHSYIYGAKFTIVTDCTGLLGLFNKGVQSIRVQRWGMLLKESGAELIYQKGKTNLRADMLSRINHAYNDIAIIDSTEWVDPDAFSDKDAFQRLPLIYDDIDINQVQQKQEQEYEELFLEARHNIDSLYSIVQGVLYSTALPQRLAAEYPRLVLPSDYHNRIIDRAHKEVGHMATDKTLRRISESYVWPEMRSTIRKRLAKCAICLVHSQKQVHVPMGEMPLAAYPFQICSADLVGPLPASNPHNNRYILNILCHSSGYAECFPIPDKTNKSVWDKFAQEFVPRHGYMETLITDNGKEFVARAWREYLNECGIKHVTTTPNHPISNGRIERFNKSIKSILAKLINNRTSDWEDKLAAALTAHRNTVSNVTGYTPHFLVFGRHARIPLTRCLQVQNVNPLGNRLNDLAEALREARTNTLASRQYNRLRLQKQANAGAISVGDSVILKAEEALTFTSKWDPQYTVTRVSGPVIHILHQQTGKSKVVNREKLLLVDATVRWDDIPKRPRRQQNRAARATAARQVTEGDDTVIDEVPHQPEQVRPAVAEREELTPPLIDAPVPVIKRRHRHKSRRQAAEEMAQTPPIGNVGILKQRRKRDRPVFHTDETLASPPRRRSARIIDQNRPIAKAVHFME